ncbi:MAG: hypothetical protein MJZ89_02530 [Paludibacteraceae bacterium]|nr:hypothetical protein [Paludibacteraceae bacterium]
MAEVSSFEDILNNNGVLVYTNVGTSMMPLLRQRRDLLIIRKKEANERLHWLDIPLFKRDNGQYIMHRVMRVRKQDYVMCGDNQWRPEYGVREDQILGVLTAVERDGKTLDMASTKMRIYGLLQYIFFPIRASWLFAKCVPGALKRRILKKH